MPSLKELRERVNSPGAFRGWRHPKSLNETSSGTIDLGNLGSSSRMVYDYSKTLVRCTSSDDHPMARRAVFAIMQNLFPIVEALDPDSAKYLAQAVEQLRR